MSGNHIPVIVGLSGYARSGKDTAAQVLVDRFGFKRVAFADTLRSMLYAINPVVPDSIHGRVAELVDAEGWDVAKEQYPEVRQLLQRLGTEAGRNILGEDVWVDAAMRNLHPAGRYVFTDVRFRNEALAVTSFQVNGELWRIERTGVGPANDHVSEVGLDDWEFDTIILNQGLAEFRDTVKSIARRRGW